VQDGWTVRAVYNDQSPTNVGGPLPAPAVSTARVNCKPFLGEVRLNTSAAAAGEPFRRTNIVGGCDVGRVVGGRGDLNLDAGEDVVYQVGFANHNTDGIPDLRATLSCQTGVGACDSLSSLGSALTGGTTVDLGYIPPGREGIAAWTLHVDQNVKSLATADRFVDFIVSFSAVGSDFGDVLATQTFTFREAVQADTEILYYNTDFKNGGTQAADRNRDGIIRTTPAGSTARNRELQTYQSLTNPGNPNLAVAAQMPWRFDSSNGGFTAFRTADSKPGGPGSSQNSLGWFYSTGGGCGWQTQNNGVAPASANPNLPKGTWHAGHGPVGTFRTANACPTYTVPSDPATAPLTEYIHDVLWSPVLQQVNTLPDARGIEFDVRMEAVGWNETQSFTDTGTYVNLEVDSNIDDGGVILGDSYEYRPPFGSNGPRTSAANSQRTFGPLRDSDGSLSIPKGGANGDEVGVSEPIVQRVESNFRERPLMSFPTADVDATTFGFQNNQAIDGGTGLPIIPGICTSNVCTSGGDATLSGPCAVNADCTGPGTTVGHSTAWGPVRNREIDLPAGRFEEFRGSKGNRFQFELGWFLAEGGQGGDLGWTIDDVYFEWSERHPTDQDPNGPNDCANIPNRPGANPGASQCGTVAFERLTIHNCTTGVKVTVTDPTPNLGGLHKCDTGTGKCILGLKNTACTIDDDCLPCALTQVAVDVRSTDEPLGETFCLDPAGPGVFTGVAQLSAISNQPGILFVNATQGENFNAVASYADPECDQDSDGELGENNFLDIDGDAVPNFGIDGVSNDISPVNFFAEGQGVSDDDNCFDDLAIADVYNPAGIPQRDNNGGGTISSEDCPTGPRFSLADPKGSCVANVCAAGAANKVGLACTRNSDCENHGRALNGQCDWDNDGFGDLCDNCPLTPNNNQLDSDSDGVGDACEVNDIDGDTIVNSADNCPTLYNPSQAGGLRGAVCDDTQDRDSDGIPEVADNCPNETGGLELGVPAPPISATYNPQQVDTDGDGIGDKCDSEDYDNDGVINALDNCPTFPNAADPTFQIQTDSDLDGFGDDRDDRDTVPGPAAYCDPDSADDDGLGIPDDLIQVASELSCNWSSFGITTTNQGGTAVGSLAVANVALTDDGTADWFCTSGDPDPNNNPAFPEPCPQENSGSPNNDSFCDNPGQPGTGVCETVPDGIADPGELAAMQISIVNASTDRSTGSPRGLNNLTVGIRATTPAVGCTPKAEVFMGNLGAGASATTPPGALNFIVDPAQPGPGRSSAVKLAEAAFALTAQADGVEGIAPLQAFKFFVDVDRFDAPPIAASCPQFPAINAAGVLCEDFDTDRNLNATYDFTRLAMSASGTDPLRANGDQTDDVLGFTIGTGPVPTGTGAVTCPGDTGFSNCQAPVAEENDWHLHTNETGEGPGTGYNSPATGASPKAHSGVRSMHMGRHLDGATTVSDTIRLRQVSAFVLDSQGDPTVPGIVIGPTTSLEFWHMISVPDDENFGSGFISPGTSFGGGQVQLTLLGSDGKFEKWQRLTANLNGYDSLDQGTVSLCAFDPGDDQAPPANETFCDSSQGPMWADMGDIIGTDATCTVDTDGNDPQHKDCGDFSGCTPGPGCTENGTVGTGVWVRSAFDLSPFAGRIARLRWIGMVEGGWSFGTSRSALEPAPGGIAYQYYDGDDGWWIDDIVLTDLRQVPSTIGPDNVTGLSQCVVGQSADNCGTMAVGIAGALDLGSALVLNADVQSQAVVIDARPTAAGDNPATVGVVEGSCDYGVLQYQFSECLDPSCASSDIVQAFSPASTLTVAPSVNTLYKVEARCSSDLTCADSRNVAVNVYVGTEFDDPNAALYPPCSATAPATAIAGPAGVAKFTNLPGEGGTCTAGACSAGFQFLKGQPCATGTAGNFFCSGALEVLDSSATLRWPTRPRPNGWGYNVWRYASASSATGVDLFAETPAGTGVATFIGALLASNIHAVSPLPVLVTHQDTGVPTVGQVYFYQVAPYHHPVWPNHVGIRPSSSNRATVCVAAP